MTPPSKRLTHIQHGTPAGYGRHVNAGDPPCKDCLQARKQKDWENEQDDLAHKYAMLEAIHAFKGELLADWRRQAACDGQYHLLNETYEIGNKAAAIKLAREMCARCPVLEQCRVDGDARETDSTTYGFLAGETAQQRRTRRRAERAEEKAA